MSSGLNSLYPIAVFLEELKSDDTTKRVTAIRSLDNIAIALGPDKTRQQLIPNLPGDV